MSVARAILSTGLVVLDQVAFGASAAPGIYHTPCGPTARSSSPGHSRQTQRTLLSALALFEWLAVLDLQHSAYHGHSSPLAFLTHACQTRSYAAPGIAACVLGVLLAALGALIRWDAGAVSSGVPRVSRASPVQSRWHTFARHPEEAGALLFVAGAALTHLTEGGVLVGCTPSWETGMGKAVAALLCGALALRASAGEVRMREREMRVAFGRRWSSYTSVVRWKVIPGVY
ncbi:uncharacterized protein SCHCODRAFT_01217575 [Schizophyllum commune H4-8]|uniref:Protein-S-isoprenylcysteine O-methyltransferase n=1 Tax=Schizophyllum commune (strain H4-8 / FGSC 9210) TaxID=578458 RepID=D8QK97_SCHCM|nr:uncharacterized protein SCHCODRAFT_01217575 [Schizophyllum commune H4-8]KAI5885020.1 hypothetical protein SCHCODRAFT_01217575 [Schizophyllum commune H4-8]